MFTEMEAGVMKICCGNGSGINEKNIAETEAGLVKSMLLKWKREFL